MLQAQFSSDGDKVAGAGADGTVRIWRLDGSKPLVLYGHDGPVTSIDFNPDGSQVVSGGKDGTVRIWDAGGDHMRVLLRRHGGEVAGVAFSSDGRRVLSGATDGIVVSQCEVCGRFADVLALAKTRPHVSLSPAERARLEGD
jgi:WD40 repeat protein